MFFFLVQPLVALLIHDIEPKASDVTQTPPGVPIRTLGNDELSAAILGVLTLLITIVVLSPFVLSSSTIVALLIVVTTFVAV